MTLHLRLPDGHVAELLETDGRHVSLLLPHAAPTGSVVRVILSEQEPPLQIKVRGCHRVGESSSACARYRVEGRFVNLSRMQREQLLGHEARPNPKLPASH